MTLSRKLLHRMRYYPEWVITPNAWENSIDYVVQISAILPFFPSLMTHFLYEDYENFGWIVILPWNTLSPLEWRRHLWAFVDILRFMRSRSWTSILVFKGFVMRIVIIIVFSCNNINQKKSMFWKKKKIRFILYKLQYQWKLNTEEQSMILINNTDTNQ